MSANDTGDFSDPSIYVSKYLSFFITEYPSIPNMICKDTTKLINENKDAK